jgi:hypothetical protein
MIINGASIRQAIADGATVRAVKTANRAHTKPVIQYRLVALDGTFWILSRYQALAHLDARTASLVDLYASILAGLAEKQFSKRVEFNGYARFMCANNPEYHAAYADCQKTAFTDLTRGK